MKTTILRLRNNKIVTLVKVTFFPQYFLSNSNQTKLGNFPLSSSHSDFFFRHKNEITFGKNV